VTLLKQSGRQRRHRIGDDDGAAVVEGTLVMVVLVVLFLGVLQVGFALHVRNTLIACAADGARYGANADRTPDDAAARTRELVASALGQSYAQNVTAGMESSDGVATVVVEVRATLPLLGPLGPSESLVVRGHALKEPP
jgi:Flp pilus assembly protein TadG